MAGLHTARSSRLLVARLAATNSSSPRYLNPTLAPLSPFKFLSLASPPTSRNFTSSVSRSGWVPAWLGGSSNSPVKDSPANPAHVSDATPSAAAHVDANPTMSLDSSAVAVSPPAPADSAADNLSEKISSVTENEISSGFTLPSSTTNSAADLISSGTLDLTSLSGSWGPHPIMRLQSMLLNLHEHFPLLGPDGLPWYILIPTVTVALRMILFGFQVRAQANAARLAIIQPEMLAGMQKLKAAKARGDFTGQQAAQLETQQLMTKHNVNPIRNLVFPLAQASVFMTMFFALRGLAGAGLPSMATEGLLWVQNLTLPDPYWILPLLSTSLTLATLELGVDSSTQVQTTTTRNMKTIFRGLLLVSLPFIAYFPAALLLYWSTNNGLSLIQSLILKQPAVRKFFNIPVVPPKPQPGDANYVAEPSMAEAFRNMQLGVQDKWEEAKENSEREKKRREEWQPTNQVKAQVYEPRPPQSTRGEIRAVPLTEKAKRVNAARERRNKKL